MYIVLVYDVSKDENGQKRWSHIFKICKKYLTHIQNSVILFKSRSEKWLDKEFWGKEDDLTSFII